jgi:hypothetical protein
MLKKYVIVLFFAGVAINVFSQDYCVMYTFDGGGDPQLSYVTRQYDASLHDAIKANKKYVEIKLERGQTVFACSFQMEKSEYYKIHLNFLINKKSISTDSEIYSFEYDFTYPQKDAVLRFLTDTIIRENLDTLFNAAIKKEDDGSIDAWRSRIDNEKSEFDPECSSIEKKITILPFCHVQDGNRVYVESEKLSPEIVNFTVYEKSLADDFLLSEKTYSYPIREDEFSEDKEELKNILEGIKVRMRINGTGNDPKEADIYTLEAIQPDISSYEVTYFFTEPEHTGNFTIDRSNERQVTYQIRRLPEYNFSTSPNDFKLTANSISYILNSDTQVIFDINLFIGDYLEERDKIVEEHQWHYFYINKDMAEFLNNAQGKLEVILSENFDIKLSVIKLDFDHLESQMGNRLKLNENRNKYLLVWLHDANEYGDIIAEPVNIKDNLYALDINERIDTDKDDYYVRMEFESDIAGNENGLYALQDIKKTISHSNLPVSMTAINSITSWLRAHGNDFSVNWYIDIAKLYMYFGMSDDAKTYLRLYEKGIQDRLGRQNNNEKYKIAFYEKLADYYAAIRNEGSFSNTGIPEDLVYDDSEEIINTMRRFTGAGNESSNIPLENNILFEIRVKQEHENIISASEFLPFIFPALGRTLFRIQDIPEDDRIVLERVFTP